MARFKYTMLIRQTTNTSGGSIGSRIGGWSESVYGPDETVPNVALFDLLCQARAGLLTKAAAIIGQRFQQVSPKGRSSTGGNVRPGTQIPQSDSPQMAVLCSAFSPTGNIRRFTLRGLPDARTIEGEYMPSVDWIAALDVYFTQLSAWKFKARNLAASFDDIVSITDGGVFELATGIGGLGNGTLVDVLRSKTDEGNLVGGSGFKVKASTGTDNGTLIGWDHGPTTGGRMRLTATIYCDMPRDGLTLVRTTQHKVGRPFDAFRGRASNRR